MSNRLTHFSHPKHELKLREYHLPRVCNLCGKKLTGRGYSCDHGILCDVDLHEDCAMYPETLRSFFAHPPHDLTLTLTAGHGTSRPPRVCGMCREDVSGDDGDFLYRCVPCGFAMHPRCSRLPQTALSSLHPGHRLTAVPGGAAGTTTTTCAAACGEPCDGCVVYRCGPCNVDLHVACLHGATRPSSSSSSGTTTQLQAAILEAVVESVVGALF